MSSLPTPASPVSRPATRYLPPLGTVVHLFVGGLAAGRVLYEAAFPRLLWLAQPLSALLFAAALAGILFLLGRRYGITRRPLLLSPLLLNLLYLFTADVNLVRSRFLLAASLWLTAVFLLHRRARPQTWRRLGVFFLLAALLPPYLLTMPATVGRADTFEFQVVAPQLGIAHPTGYPLYLLLGKAFTLLPWGSVAWRLNLGTAVLALAAAVFLYQAGRRLLQRPLPALLGAAAFGLTPVFWSQAIEAEVYALHALIVAAALWLMLGMLPAANPARLYLLFGLIGLGLTNHLTTVFLLPPAALTLYFNYRAWRPRPAALLRQLLLMALALALPLLLYAYLPLRWQAVNGEPMGVGRFLDWVIGGRFQDALQWNAWLRDPTRYVVIGRLFRDNWGLPNLVLAAIGLVHLFQNAWHKALLLLAAWLGFTFYCLNYYVPDLAVFLIPAQLVVGLWWAAGLAAVGALAARKLLPAVNQRLQPALITLLLLPILLLAAGHWPQIDRSDADGGIIWGQGVLALPLDQGAAILADSEKIAPLFYLQQAEGVRPDLEIMVLPNEAAYRAELDARVVAGQTVYLARFLPGLEGVYHLRSVGPLTEVSAAPLLTLPDDANPADWETAGVALRGYRLETAAAVDPGSTAVTLYWQADQSTDRPYLVYVRWAGGDPMLAAGQHPANNYYPTTAWQAGEIVPDFHLLPHPVSPEPQSLPLQMALAPPFTPAAELTWQAVTTVTLPATPPRSLSRPLRAQIGDALLAGAAFPAQTRPQRPLLVTLTGSGNGETLTLSLDGGTETAVSVPTVPFTLQAEVDTNVDNGRYSLIAAAPETAARCGWLAPLTAGCPLGEVAVQGAPLPAEAINFDDKIALLEIDLETTTLQPGGQLPVSLTWQGLAPMTADYTIFIQVLDANDQIVGQVDAWPVQGTYPTSRWSPGEMVRDPHVVQLQETLPPGSYQIQVGWYLLATLRRLPVVDDAGAPVDDKVVVPGLTVVGE